MAIANWASLSKEEQRRINQMTPAERQARQGGGGAGGGGGAAASKPVNYKDPVAVSAAVAEAGLAAGKDPTTQAAQQGVQNVLAGQGGAGSGSGYQNYNPINDELATRLLGESSDADELVRQFLGGGGTVGGGGAPAYDPKDPYAIRPGAHQVISFGNQNPSLGGTGTGQGGGVVPDASGTGLFGTKVRELLDSGGSDADLQTIIDAQNADINRGLSQSLWDLDAQAQGTGRFGGDMWAGLQNQARGDAVGQMGTFASKTRLGELADRRSLYQNLLGQVNARDIASMSDQTQRYGINASASAAGAGNAEANALARRGQDLSALGMLLDNQQFNTGQLSGLGDRLSTDQLSSIGMAPDLAGISLAGLGAANQAAGNQVSLRGAQISGGVARAGQNLQAQMFNSGLQQQQLNDYLRTVMGLGSMGGSSHTEGSNVVPGLGVNPTGAAIQGGVGAGLAAWGYGR